MDRRSIFEDGVPRHSDDLIHAYEAAGYWGEATILSRLREVARRNPEKTAIVEEDVRLSYANLEAEIDRLRSGLAGLGLSRGDPIAVQLPNWWEHLPLLFAIVDLGALYVPVSVRLRGELEYIMRFTEARAIVLPEAFHGFDHHGLIAEMRARLPSLRQVIVPRAEQGRGDILTYDSIASGGDGKVPPATLSPNGPWQIMFTSGTTAAPKGVVRTHNNTLWTMRNLSHCYDFIRPDGSDVSLAILPVSFVFAQYLCALGGLLHGGTLVLQAAFDPTDALDLIEKERVTYFGIVPSLVERFFEVPDLDQRDLSSLRLVSPAGEAVTGERKERMREAFGCDVLESYGLSELTWPLGQLTSSSWEKKVSTTGKPSPGAELRIVDETGHERPVGESGELWLRGPTLFPGYYRNPEATQAAVDAEGWLHTGDLARLDKDGFYSIVGRLKDVIKRKGFLIVPQEIEDAVGTHPDVLAVSVIGLPDKTRGEIACVCIVPRPGSALSKEAVIEFLRGKLATYKVPERVEVMDSLPLSPVGKVLKSELRTLLLSREASR
jgi:acyl-CoA synthetase (AMP-forming)/AMP-acid ligase II